MRAIRASSCFKRHGKKIANHFSSVAQSCLTVCIPMNRSAPGFPVHHQLLEFTQTHVHWISDVIQPTHPLSSPSPPALSLSHLQGFFPVSWFFTSGGQSIGVSAPTSVLLMNTQDWSPLDGLLGSPCSPRDSQVSSTTPQFKSINSSALSFLYSPTREGIRGQTDWNHNHRKLTNLITWTTALSNSMKLSHAVWGHPRWTGHSGEVWQNVVHWRREWQTTSKLLLWEPHEQYEEAKR